MESVSGRSGYLNVFTCGWCGFFVFLCHYYFDTHFKCYLAFPMKKQPDNYDHIIPAEHNWIKTDLLLPVHVTDVTRPKLINITCRCLYVIIRP